MFRIIFCILIGTVSLQLGAVIADAPLPWISTIGAIGFLVNLFTFLTVDHEYKKSLALTVIVPIVLFSFGCASIAILDRPLDLKFWIQLALLFLGWFLPLGSMGIMLFVSSAWQSLGFDILFIKKDESEDELEICPKCNLEIPENIKRYKYCPKCGTNRKDGER
jgi:hypothetical protein